MSGACVGPADRQRPCGHCDSPPGAPCYAASHEFNAMLRNQNADLIFALESIAQADHPDAQLCRGPCTEHEFGERLMKVARAALAKARA